MQKTSPKDFFLNLGSIILLYTGATNLLNLIFYVIDKIYPDQALDYSYSYESSSIRWAIASLIIIYPLYLYILKIINKDTEMFPEKRELGVRKWLTYLTLFIAGTAISVDLVVSLNAFLGGELTARFLSKVLAVFAVMVLIFKYYILDLKGDKKYEKKIFWIANLLIFSSLVSGFYIMGSPAKQRMLRIDETKVSDLQNIQWQIINYWQQKEKIPAKLSDLNDPISGFIVPKETGSEIEYRYETVSTTTFKLCANFDLDSEEGDLNNSYPKALNVNMNENWNHKAGLSCFERKIDVELYPPRIKQ